MRISKAKKERLADQGLKYCPRCSSIKSTDEFYTAESRADNLLGYCKECHIEVVKHSQNKQKANRYRKALNEF